MEEWSKINFFLLTKLSKQFMNSLYKVHLILLSIQREGYFLKPCET